MNNALIFTEAQWRKSTYSGVNNGDCVEASHDFPGIAPVRDRKTAHGPIVVASETAWDVFLGHIKH